MLRPATMTLMTLMASAAFLTGAPAASATPLCEGASVTGVVNAGIPTTCIPYNLGTTCASGQAGLDPTLVVHDHICTPSLLGE
jgi:hypothetical protein